MGKKNNNKAGIDVQNEDSLEATDGQKKHLLSLIKLAEKTVAETQSMAEEAKQEALAQAKAEAITNLAKAEERAQQMMEEKRLEARTAADKEMEVIKANAGQMKRLCTELMSQFESLKQQIEVSQKGIQRSLSQLDEQTNLATIGEESGVTLGTQLEMSCEARDSTDSEVMEQVQSMKESDTDELEKKAPISAEKQAITEYEGEVRLEILPPIIMNKVNDIVKYLDKVPEVETTQVVPTVNKPSIEVFLRGPVPLVEMLKTLPQVSQVFEVKDGAGKASVGGGTRSTIRRLQMQLWL